MQAAGFEWIYMDPGLAMTVAQNRAASVQREFPLDRTLEADGYLASAPEPRPEQTNDDLARALGDSERAAYSAAFFGAPTDKGTTIDLLGGGSFQVSETGCLAQAQVHVFGTLAAALDYAAGDANRVLAARQRALADPTVQAALTAWQACMSSAGFQFEHFGEARAAAGSLAASEASVLFQADLACTESSDLHDRFQAGYEAALSDLYRQAGGELQDRQELVKQAIERIAAATG